jgi:hypothetical protein
MGKHGNEHLRVERDKYPTPDWVTNALAEYVRLDRRSVWECAAGDGRMARALAVHGAQVFSSDLEPQHPDVSQFDFLMSGLPPGLKKVDLIISNPPWGIRNLTAVAFIESGLRRIAEHGGMLALLLSTDFDSAVTRNEFFRNNPFFCGRIILTARPVWFKRSDGEREAPKENVCWYLWQRPTLRFPPAPAVFYAQSRPPKKARNRYDAHDDIGKSVLAGFAEIRRRVKNGGAGWGSTPKESFP